MNFFPKKILLATDGSEDAKLALDAAVDLSNETDSELHLVYVALASPWVMPDVMNPEQAERYRQESQKILDEQTSRVEGEGGKVAESYLRTGRKASHEIIRLSEEIGAGVIVMGSRGMGAVERIMLGSDSESVVKQAPCPVFVVRRED
jgi:nucleotide-binding universal stress UspA family protein